MSRRDYDEAHWDFDRKFERDTHREPRRFAVKPLPERSFETIAIVQDAAAPVEIEHCISCGRPAHATETDDQGVCQGVCTACLGGES